MQFYFLFPISILKYNISIGAHWTLKILPKIKTGNYLWNDYVKSFNKEYFGVLIKKHENIRLFAEVILVLNVQTKRYSLFVEEFLDCECVYACV